MRWDRGWLGHVARSAREFFERRRRHRPIHYGDREFTAPQLLSEALLPRSPAIYAIQVPHWWSGLTPIHFGTAHNLQEELTLDDHEGFVHWIGHRRGSRGVYVSFHLLEAGDADNRHREAARLNRHYFPRRSHSFEEHLELHGFYRPPLHRSHPHGNGAH